MNFIHSFVQLEDIFVQQLASRKKIEKQTDNLYQVKQKKDEHLWEYLSRFHKEKIYITHYDESITIQAFRRDFFPTQSL